MRAAKRILASCIILGELLVILAGGVHGQEPSRGDINNASSEVESRILNLLASSRTEDRAWGAYLVGDGGMKNVAPQLLKLFDRGYQNLTFQEELVYHCALDSLIQLNASIPPRMIIPLFDRFRNEALILASRSPKETQGQLLGLMMEDRVDLEWLAIGNILSKEKTPGFAALLLQGLPMTAYVDVEDNPFRGAGGGIGISTSCCGASGPPQLIEGYPPIGLYRIQDEIKESDGLVSDGRHPIYYQRRMVRAGEHFASTGGCPRSTERGKYKLEYIADMLNIPDENLGLTLDPSFRIEWHNSLDYRQEVERINKSLKSAFGNLIIRLAVNQLLSTSEAQTLTPNITFRIKDSRDDKSVALPKVAGINHL